MDTPAEIAAKQLKWSMETMSSVEVEVTTQIIPFGESAKRTPDFTAYLEHYIETSAGQRFLEFRGMKDGAVVSRFAHYGEEGKFTDVNYVPKEPNKQVSVFITNHFFMEDSSDRRQMPPPLLSLYVGRKPLHEALPKAEYLGPAECLGRECERFLFKQVRWNVLLDQVFTLDKKTSIPLKVENFRDEASRLKDQPMLTWAAKSLDAVQGHDLPLKSSLSQLGNDGRPIFTWDSEVNKIKFNETYPDSTFHPVIQPGVLVLDGKTNKSYKTPGAVTVPPPSPPTVPGVGQSVQAIPPGNWSATISTGSLVLGAVLVMVGGLAWWRRR